MWVEKILHPGEPLRDWPVEGTVGYEFLNDAAALFVDPAGEGELTDLFAQLTGETRAFAEVALEAQVQQAIDDVRARGRPAALAARFDPAAPSPTRSPPLPIYRTYVEPATGHVEREDRIAIEAAGIGDRLADVLLLRERGHDEFVTRFQQTSPPVTAKGVEDTAFYRYNRLLALNEVGGDPGRFGIGVADFHAANAERAERFPRGLLVTQTHDTKRSGDVRARIGALAGMAREWREHVLRWREINAGLRADGAPDANEEYLIYQTLAGAWPIERDRLEAYVEKALREAKRNTSWVEPDDDWEARVKRFAVALLSHEPFLEDFEPFAARVAEEGRRSALGQLLLKLTSPGVAGHLPGRRARGPVARRPRQPPPGRLGGAPRGARRAASRRRAVAGDDEAARHPHGARAALTATGGVRRRVRAALRRGGRVRVPARRRRARRRAGARLGRRVDRRPRRPLARRPRERRTRPGRRGLRGRARRAVRGRAVRAPVARGVR